MQVGPEQSLIAYDDQNVFGETRVHQIFKEAEKDALLTLADLVRNSMVNIEVTTTVLSNPFHYAAHITDPNLLEIVFNMATAELIMQKNQLNESPLSLAITQDNAAFFAKALEAFPQILDLIATQEGLAMQYVSLLHDIARLNAQRCFAILKDKFTDAVWTQLKWMRIEEQLPSDVAVLAGHNEMFQLLADYRRGNLPTLTWLLALKIAEAGDDAPPYLESIVNDAKDELQYQRAQAEWDAQEDTDEFEASVSQRLSMLRLS